MTDDLRGTETFMPGFACDRTRFVNDKRCIPRADVKQKNVTHPTRVLHSELDSQEALAQHPFLGRLAPK